MAGGGARVRALKPEIPLTGAGGVPIADELEFEQRLGEPAPEEIPGHRRAHLSQSTSAGPVPTDRDASPSPAKLGPTGARRSARAADAPPDGAQSKCPAAEGSAMGIHLTVRESIAVPPDRVLAAMTDEEQLPRWLLNVVRFEKLTEGPLAVGSRWRQTRLRFGEPAEDLLEILRLEPPHLYDVRVQSSRGENIHSEYVFGFRLEPAGGGTLVTLGVEGEVRGVDYGPAPEMIAHTVGTLLAADLASLKRYLEGQA